ncbi:MAG: ABC transporter permease [Acetobacteraceae bacterium]|nr:ABC transporter permease [Acetobacteraceae bacterium]
MASEPGSLRPLSWYAGLVYLFLYAPVFLLILFSFNASPSGSFPFTGFTLRWYHDLAADAVLLQALKNTLFVAAVATPTATVIGALCAFGLVRGEFRLKSAFTSLLLLPIVIPGILLGAALLIVLVPVMGIRLSIWTAAAGHVVVTTPYAVLAVATRLYGYDRRLDLAAADLGASPSRVLRHVTLPLIMPGILAAALVVFTVSLDTFGVTFFTIGSSSTLPMYIFAQVENGITPALNALGTLMLAASVLFLLGAARLMRAR